MIRATATTDTSIIDDLIYQMQNHDKIVAEIGTEVHRQYAGEALSHLQVEPGTPKYPLKWASEKQRRFVMAKLTRENNLPYRRSHDLSQAWEVIIKIEGGVLRFIIENPAPQAKFVYGSLAKDVSAAARFQQPFHRQTGWQQASVTARYWLQVFQDEFTKRYRVRLAQFGKSSSRSRAFTR